MVTGESDFIGVIREVSSTDAGERARVNEDPRQATVDLLRFLLDQELMLIGNSEIRDSKAGRAPWERPSSHSSRVVKPTVGNRRARSGARNHKQRQGLARWERHMAT